MTVLSPFKGKAAARGFPLKGRYSYISLLFDFAEWGVDLPWVRMRITQLKTSEDVAVLFRDILVARGRNATWHHHPDARGLMIQQLQTLTQAWDATLMPSPDRDQLTLEYLADALKVFARQTKLC